MEELVKQVRSKGDADDEIMVQVNEKVEEWKVRCCPSKSENSLKIMKLWHEKLCCM